MEPRKERRYWLGIAATAGAAGLLLPFAIAGNLLNYAWRIVSAAVEGTYHTVRILVVFVPNAVTDFDRIYRQKRLENEEKQKNT